MALTIGSKLTINTMQLTATYYTGPTNVLTYEIIWIYINPITIFICNMEGYTKYDSEK
jgi:hypothetical protein